MEITVVKRVEIAKQATARSANMKDWRIRNKHNRKMREIARELVEKNGGYVIASAQGIFDIYGINVGGLEDTRKFVWGIEWNHVWKKLDFMPI